MLLGLGLDAITIFKAFNNYSKDPVEVTVQKKEIDSLFSQIRYLGLTSLFISQMSEWASKLAYKKLTEYLDDKLDSIPPRRPGLLRI